MKLDTLLIADAVSVPADGKFYIHGGGYSRIEISALPAPIPISVFARFVIEDGDEEDEHRILFTLIGPAGVPNVDPMEVRAFAAKGKDQTEPTIDGELHFLNVPLQIPAVAVRTGIYRLQVDLDGEVVRELPLPVILDQGATARPKRSASKKPKAKKRPPPPPRKKQRRRH